jgi:phosphoenolpyruvate synthase/pyruvate phosphate dikinase
VTYVLPLDQCSPDRSSNVGGKARGLYSLIAQKLPVPPGFAVTAAAYRDVVRETGVQCVIDEYLNRADLSADEISKRILSAFDSLTLPEVLVEEINRAYAELDSELVAVRSSGTAEDTAAASFAGQHDTYLWVSGAESVCAHVLRCWASLFNAGAIIYRKRFDTHPSDVAMGVVIQQMVPATSAGVMMTLEPVTGDRSQVYIESAHGLGEGVVVGDVEVDRFWVDKSTLQVSRREISLQAKQYAYDEALGSVSLQSVDPSIGQLPSLSADLVLDVAKLGCRIEDSFEMPMDIEWAVSPNGEILLLQARPETVWSNRAPRLQSGRNAETKQYGRESRPMRSQSSDGATVPGVKTSHGRSLWTDTSESEIRRRFSQLKVRLRRK